MPQSTDPRAGPSAQLPGLMPSVLDRLIDPDSAGTIARHGYSIPQMIEAVRRDLEELLNSRRASNEIPEQFAELRKSVLNYGMPEVVNLPALTGEQRQQIGRVLEQVIAFFEPRLREVRARLVGGSDLRERAVRFHVEGRLRVDPAPEVEFETVLELSSGRAGVRSGPQGA